MSAAVTKHVRWSELVLLGLVFLVACEGMVRIEDAVRYGTPLITPFHDQGQLVVRDRDGMHGRPNARFQKWILDAHGMRGPSVTLEKAPGVYRLMTIGASETFGLYESPGREYPRQLEDSLEAMRRDGRCRCAGVSKFEVANAALLGMSLPTAVQDVRIRLSRFHPDMILVYPTPPGYLQDQVPRAAAPDSSAEAGRTPLSAWFYPRALDRLREQAKAMLPSWAKDVLRRREIAAVAAAHPAGWPFETVPAERVDRFEQDLRVAVGAIRAVGATPMLVSHANAFRPGEPRDPVMLNQWARFYPRASGNVIVDFDDLAAQRTALVAADSALPFADWHRASQQDGPGLFRDFSHFSDRGAALAAHLMAGTIVAYLDRTA